MSSKEREAALRAMADKNKEVHEKRKEEAEKRLPALRAMADKNKEIAEKMKEMAEKRNLSAVVPPHTGPFKFKVVLGEEEHPIPKEELVDSRYADFYKANPVPKRLKNAVGVPMPVATGVPGAVRIRVAKRPTKQEDKQEDKPGPSGAQASSSGAQASE